MAIAYWASLVGVYIHVGKSARQRQEIRALVEAAAADLSVLQIDAVGAQADQN